MKNQDNPNEWLVDEDAAAVVKKIFNLCLEGYGTSQIAKLLQKEQILTPRAYWVTNGRIGGYEMPDNPYRWVADTISVMLAKPEYLGHTVNFKTYKKSYKSKSHMKIQNKIKWYLKIPMNRLLTLILGNACRN